MCVPGISMDIIVGLCESCKKKTLLCIFSMFFVNQFSVRELLFCGISMPFFPNVFTKAIVILFSRKRMTLFLTNSHWHKGVAPLACFKPSTSTYI